MSFWDYTGAIGKGIGTLIGMWYGGPVGAQLGGMAGEAEGGKIGAVGKGEANWTSLLSPGPAQQEPQQQPAQLGPLAYSSLGESLSQGNAMADYDPNLIDVPPGTPGENRTTAQVGAPAPTGGGFDFGGLLTGIGRTLSATAAGLQGDNSYGLRLQQVMDQAAQQKEAMEIAKRRSRMEELEALPKALDTLDRVRRLGLNPEQQKSAAQLLDEQFKGSNLSIFGDAQQIEDFISSDSPSLQQLRSAFDVVKTWDRQSQLDVAELYRKDPAKAGQVVSQRTLSLATRFAQENQPIPDDYKVALAGEDRANYEKRVGNIVFGNVKKVIAAGGLDKNISRADFMARFPNADALGEDHFTQFVEMGYPNLKPLSSSKKEIEGKTSPMTGDQVFAAAAKAKYPDDPVAQAEYVKELRRNPESASNIIFQDALKRHGGDIKAASEEYADFIARSSGARASGAETGKLEVQKTPQYQQTQRDISEARGMGARSAEAREQLTALTQSAAILDELDQLTSRFITANTTQESNIQGAKLGTEAVVSKGSLPGVYLSRRKNLAEALARNIGGVKGTATEGDIDRMVEGLPSFRDTVQSRQYKINAVRTIIDTAVENKRLFIEGKPIDLEQSKMQFKSLVDDFLAGKLKPTEVGGGRSGVGGLPKVLSIERME